MPAILGSIFFIAPLLVKVVLPKFIPGILAIQILLVDMFFRACYPQASHFIIALKKQIRIIPLMAALIILSFAINYVLIKKGYGIYGVAWGTSIVSFLTFIALQIYAMKHFAGPREILLFFLEVMAPFLYSVIAVLCLEYFIKAANIYVETAVKSCLFLFLSVPMLVYVNKKTGVVGIVFKAIREMLHV
jgi:Na+-driven multidrug efflux pump